MIYYLTLHYPCIWEHQNIQQQILEKQGLQVLNFRLVTMIIMERTYRSTQT